MAFIGQVSNVGTAFFVFALILLPTLMFLGFATFNRVMQSGIEDMYYARGINRIRHYYLEQAPVAERYFIQASHDDTASVLNNMAIGSGPWQLFLSTAGTVGVIDSVLGAVFAGLVVYVAGRGLGVAGLLAPIVSGLFAFSVLVYGHYRMQVRTYLATADRIPVLFPSADSQGRHGAGERALREDVDATVGQNQGRRDVTTDSSADETEE